MKTDGVAPLRACLHKKAILEKECMSLNTQGLFQNNSV